MQETITFNHMDNIIWGKVTKKGQVINHPTPLLFTTNTFLPKYLSVLLVQSQETIYNSDGFILTLHR